MKLTVTTLITALIASTAWMSFAQEEKPDTPDTERDNPREREGRRGPGGRGDLNSRLPIYKVLDADEDGEISAEEIENAVAALKKLDKNNDGKLDAQEIAPTFGRRGGARGGRGGAGARPGRERGDDRPDRPRRPRVERPDSAKEDPDEDPES